MIGTCATARGGGGALPGGGAHAKQAVALDFTEAPRRKPPRRLARRRVLLLRRARIAFV